MSVLPYQYLKNLRATLRASSELIKEFERNNKGEFLTNLLVRSGNSSSLSLDAGVVCLLLSLSLGDDGVVLFDLSFLNFGPAADERAEVASSLESFGCDEALDLGAARTNRRRIRNMH